MRPRGPAPRWPARWTGGRRRLPPNSSGDGRRGGKPELVPSSSSVSSGAWPVYVTAHGVSRRPPLLRGAPRQALDHGCLGQGKSPMASLQAALAAEPVLAECPAHGSGKARVTKPAHRRGQTGPRHVDRGVHMIRLRAWPARFARPYGARAREHTAAPPGIPRASITIWRTRRFGCTRSRCRPPARPRGWRRNRSRRGDQAVAGGGARFQAVARARANCSSGPIEPGSARARPDAVAKASATWPRGRAAKCAPRRARPAPRAVTICPTVRPASRIARRNAACSSSATNGSRCAFSQRAMAAISASVSGATATGSVVRPARRAAYQRRSPNAS